MLENKMTPEIDEGDRVKNLAAPVLVKIVAPGPCATSRKLLVDVIVPPVQLAVPSGTRMVSPVAAAAVMAVPTSALDADPATIVAAASRISRIMEANP